MVNQRLELTWIGKGDDPAVEPRILLHDPSKDYGDPNTENMLIHGDNLLALKALEQQYAGQVKCIYIDPPYNTGEAFENYDDNLEHSIWLRLMYARVRILKNLLSDDGFFCCQIDDSEGHYLKVMLDEIFGRDGYYQTTIYVRVRYPEKTLKQDMAFHKEIEQVHIYRKSNQAKPILDKVQSGYEKFKYKIETLSAPIKVLELGGKRVEVYKKGDYIITEEDGSEYGLKEIWASGTILDGNSSGRFFRDYLTGRYAEDGYGVIYKVYGIGDDRYNHRFFTGPNREGATKGKYYQGVPLHKLESGEMTRDVPINGFIDLAAYFGNCRQEGGAEFRGGKKPEILIKTLLSHFTKEGDLVLDSFLGSGTTAAVAHKMNRRYIGIELGNHCYTLCIPRLTRVIDGDKTGISDDVNWQGGGGYKFYELAPTLIVKDKYGNPVFSEQYSPEMLVAAVAKINGYHYAPDAEAFWKQGFCQDNSFIYVTTQYLTGEVLDGIAAEVGDFENLLICAPAFDAGLNKRYENITVRKIPQSVLDKCQYGVDNYNLNIIDPPQLDEEEWEDD
ncbi:site-specific DNA-methyltransferase [Hydrogenoanaerobacterium saccharovorans]|uniref:Site-specific DNA-methyltransferase n=1 Tax=Hydrogenoanaerobacterium saccharovorans TaxID=474960 RepID=A0ABS2GLW7_9FIRM|nr:site-specific DNA-methyltransferase [Hydrogenoanaerobacterium saccharovorans]MBM6923387.1 site-specific DNA-methyltransferase [Hydrogenoanaerobacterium saccharovorans]